MGNDNPFILQDSAGMYTIHRPVSEEDILRQAEFILEQRFTRGTPIRSPADTEEYLKKKLARFEHEIFCGMFLDNRHHVLEFEELFRGTIDGTSVYPREVVKTALKVNAAAVILAHNHPSGVAEPSQADERITTRLKSALELVDIRVLDHIIIGGNSAVSMAARGLI